MTASSWIALAILLILIVAGAVWLWRWVKRKDERERVAAAKRVVERMRSERVTTRRREALRTHEEAAKEWDRNHPSE